MSLKKLILFEAVVRDKDTLARMIKKWVVKVVKRNAYWVGENLSTTEAMKIVDRELPKGEYKYMVDGAFLHDPTDGKYVMWILSTYLKHIIKDFDTMSGFDEIVYKYDEDLPKVEEYLTLFDKYKHKLNKKDINQYESLDELFQAVSQFRYNEAGSFDEYIDTLKMGIDYSHYENPESEFDLYIPHTEKGACVLGTQTEWCTAWGTYSTNPSYTGRHSAFDSYDELAVFIKKDNPDEKYQLDLESHQFMDVNDNSIDLTKVFNGDPLLIEYLESKIDYDKLNRYIDVRNGEYYIIAEEFEESAIEPLDHVHRTSSVSVMLHNIYWHKVSNQATKKFMDYMFDYMSDKKMMKEFYSELYHHLYEDGDIDIVKELYNSDDISIFIGKLYKLNFQSNKNSSHSHIYEIEPLEKLLTLVKEHIKEFVSDRFRIYDTWYVDILLQLINSNGEWNNYTFALDYTDLRRMVDYKKLSQEIINEFR